MDDTDSPGFWLGDDGIFYDKVVVSVYRDGKNHFHLLLAKGFRHGVFVLNREGEYTCAIACKFWKTSRLRPKKDVLYTDNGKNQNLVVSCVGKNWKQAPCLIPVGDEPSGREVDIW